ncbi:MAG: Imm53 family immunity protein [Acidobacteriaceae bacterium]|nr:Imm53 family immunity protein [Acidobacteriaceae bacterium]
MSEISTNLDWLERWQAQHHAVVTIETLETGGWMVVIDTGQRALDVTLANTRSDEAGWLSASVANGLFKGAGSSLDAILTTFRHWIEQRTYA